MCCAAACNEGESVFKLSLMVHTYVIEKIASIGKSQPFSLAISGLFDLDGEGKLGRV